MAMHPLNMTQPRHVGLQIAFASVVTTSAVITIVVGSSRAGLSPRARTRSVPSSATPRR